MSFTATVALTADGMQQLHADLQAFRERHSALAWAMSASPGDLDGGMLTELALMHRRIAELQDVLARAMPLAETTRQPGVVGIGSSVKVRWEEDGEETYTIVEPAEAALDAGRISHESPVGEALVGRRAGDRVAVTTLAGTAWLDVVSVDYSGVPTSCHSEPAGEESRGTADRRFRFAEIPPASSSE